MDRVGTTRRIIVTGASGVGKTTLVQVLASALALPIIPELGRQLCLEMGYKNIGEIPDQENFKRKVLEAQILAEEKHRSFISDRSTIDYWVLWQRWNICQAMSFDTESYYQLTRGQAEKYTHVIFIPPMFPATNDGFRWTDPDYQNQIDRITRMTLYEWNLLERTYTIKSVDTEERFAEVAHWLSIKG